MFEDISEKFKKLKMPEESLIKKIERIRKTSDPGISTDSPKSSSASVIVPDISDQVNKAKEEMTRKIEEIIKSRTAQIDSSVESIKEFDVKLNKLENASLANKSSIGDFKDRLDKIDESLLELLSLYEVVSSTVNPFVGEKGNIPNEKLDQIEKKLEFLSQKDSEMPEHVKEGYNIKFKALEGSLEELTQLVDSTHINKEELIQNIAEQVMERIKPMIEQIKPMIEQNQKKNNSYTSSTPVSPDTAGRVDRINSAPHHLDDTVKLQYIDNKAETSIILLNWIEFLLEKVGRNNLSEVLEYYIDIGWINEDVLGKMLAYANGIDYFVERPTWKLLPDDHTKSLMFIEQLNGRKLDKNMLSKLERNVDKVIRTDEVYIS